jgi:hypothetical protein
MIACNITQKMSKPVAKCQSTAMVPEETWYPVPGYPRYKVSTHGRIKRIKHTDRLGRTYKEVNIKGRNTSKIGTRVVLCEKECKDYILARVVATTLYGIPLETKLTVNHIDGNRHNNNIGNLEIISREDNIRHGHKNGLYEKQYLKTALKDITTGKIYSFETQKKASQFLGKNNSYIANAKRHNKTRYGKYTLEEQNG